MAGNPPPARPMPYAGMPVWHDGMHAYGYVAAPGTAPAAVLASMEVAKKPRPRKPYTATKTREMWTTEEHNRMLEGLKLYKRDWAKVTAYVGTRSPAQVRSHAQKYFDRVQRDKTDDYVPQARPKRKSSTPYPRKMRSEAPSVHYAPPLSALPYAMSPHTPLPLTIAVDPYTHLVAQPQSPYIAHPLQPQHVAYSLHAQMHPGMYAPGGMHPQVHHMHAMPHPSPIVIGPSPGRAGQASIRQQMPPSMTVDSPALNLSSNPRPGQSSSMANCELVQTQQGPVFSPLPRGPVQVARVFSPWSTQGTPQMRGPFSQTMASPLSIDGRGYAVQPQTIGRLEEGMVVGGRQPVYSSFSPLTPAPPMGEHTPPSSRKDGAKQQLATHHVPTHSHPDGPDPNCVKCNALKRYGNVLIEIGAIRDAKIGEKQTHEAGAHTKHSQAERAAPKRSPPCGLGSVEELPKSSPATRGIVERECKPQVEVIRKRYDASRPHHFVGENGIRLSSSLPKTDVVLKGNARRIEQMTVEKQSELMGMSSSPSDGRGGGSKDIRDGRADTEQGMESPHVIGNNESGTSWRRRKSSISAVGSSANPIASVLTTDRDPKELGASPGLRAIERGAHRKRSLEGTVSSGAPKRMRSEPQVASRQSANEATVGETGVRSPLAQPPVDNYSSERRELFDAVQSLQILGRSVTPEK